MVWARLEQLHPEQDINARNKAVASNNSNAEREAAEYGTDIDDNMEINARVLAKWQKILKKHGVEEPGKLAGLFSASHSLEGTIKDG